MVAIPPAAAVCLEPGGTVCDNLSERSARKLAEPHPAVSAEGMWELLTIVVDNMYGRMQVARHNIP